jgi:hypothetical protein
MQRHTASDIFLLNLEEEEIVDTPGNHGNVLMPGQVK